MKSTLVPKTCPPTQPAASRRLPPAPSAFQPSASGKHERELQLQYLLKENQDLACEREKLLYQIEYESRQRDVLYQQNLELRSRTKEGQDSTTLTYSVSPQASEDRLRSSFSLTGVAVPSGPSINTILASVAPGTDTELLTSEELIGVDRQRKSICRPRFFVPGRIEYFSKGLLGAGLGKTKETTGAGDSPIVVQACGDVERQGELDIANFNPIVEVSPLIKTATNRRAVGPPRHVTAFGS